MATQKRACALRRRLFYTYDSSARSALRRSDAQ